MSITLYGAGISPFVRKVRVLLAEKGVAYEHDPVVPMNPPPEFRKISPLGKIPALRDGERTLADSSIICSYLERRFPQTQLYPKDDYAHARALWFEEYADSALMGVIGPGVFMPLVLGPVLRGGAPDTARAEKAMNEELPPLLSYLEGELGDKSYLVEDRLTIADISVASMFVNLLLADVRIDAKRWPKLSAYLDRLHARPSFKALIEEDRKSVAALRSRR